MRVFTGLKAIAHPPLRAVATVGVFDGVHRAHQELIRATVRLAQRLRGTSVVVTFDPDPQRVLNPSEAHASLMPLEVRIGEIQNLGVEWVWVIPFTRRFARMGAGSFIRQVLWRQLGAVALVIGETFAFGRNREGDRLLLERFGLSHGMRIVPVGQRTSAGVPISSSRIRQFIANGHLSAAKRFLGREAALYGRVVRGSGRGRLLGFPTANIELSSQVLPPTGVYAVTVHSQFPPSHHGRRRAAPKLIGRGLMNLGIRPTFGPGPLVCEVHLLNFSGKLLGRRVIVSLLGRLRSERCFPNTQALIRQVGRDLLRARRLFARRRF